MNLYGPHIHKPGMGLDLLQSWQPPVALAMDVDSEYVRKVREKSPSTILVVRVYEGGESFLGWKPQDWVGRLLAKFPAERPDFFVTINEPFGQDDVALFGPFDEWESEVVRLLQQNGTDGLACNFGTGNFTGAPDRIKIPDVFPRICDIANVMGPHDYSWPTLEDGWSWYAGRWFKWYDDIKEATGRKMQFLIGECGLTQAIISGRPDWGWQSGGMEGVTAESYLATLRWYLQQVVSWDAGRGIVLSLCLFNWYDQYHWSFEHINRPEVVNAIIAMDVPVPPPPEPPDEEDQMIRVFDIDGQELFGEAALDLIAYHGMTIHQPTNMRDGEPYWAIVRMDEREGPACFIYTGLLEDGSPAVGQQAAWAWTDDMGEDDDILGDNYPTDWQKEADLGVLNENGNMGPGFGQHGWWHKPYEPGPGRAWIRDEFCWSALLTGIGMLDMTPHRTMYATWQVELWQGNGEEPPPTDGDLLEEVRLIRKAIERIAEYLTGAPPEPPIDTGFWGEYFNNPTLSGPPTLVRDDKVIDFNWGTGSPAPEITSDQFSVRWTAPRFFDAGNYVFDVEVDDGVRLWVDGQLLIDEWREQPPTKYSASVALEEGRHDVVMEYFEQAGGAVAKLSIT